MNTPSHRTRHILFFAVTLSSPVICFALLELLLVLIGYGNAYPLVKTERIHGKQKYVTNREIARRYFSLPPDKIPDAANEYFHAQKQPKELRIFCLGGSTTAGFPYEHNATFPFQLEFRLRNALPDRYVDVVNLGIPAINSFTVLDLMPEILQLDPDLIILYMGHNEFYGAYGVGSTNAFAQSRVVTNSYLRLKKLRAVQLLGNFVRQSGSMLAGGEEGDFRSMMEAMSGGHAIPLNSDKFRQACRSFEGNLGDIIDMASQKEVPIVVGNLVSNLRNHAPFVSNFSVLHERESQERYRGQLEEGKQLLTRREFRGAAEVLSSLARRDSNYAETHFYLGETYLALTDTNRAGIAFQKARDLDELRFRAPSVFNSIIEQTARELAVPMVDLELVFQRADSTGIPGSALFVEHLHPNFDGYRLMAQTFLEAVRSLFEPGLLSPEEIEETVRTFREERGGVTPLDIEIGALRSFILTHQWPFQTAKLELDEYEPRHSEITARFARKYLLDKVPWDEVHYELAEHYASEKEHQAAFSELRAVNWTYHENVLPFLKIGDLFMSQGRGEEANWYYQRAAEKSAYR